MDGFFLCHERFRIRRIAASVGLQNERQGGQSARRIMSE